jgi:histidinol-phosphate aminotransferase
MTPVNSPAPELRPELNRIALYTPDPRLYRIDLTDNTNQWGTPPAALRAVQSAGKISLTRYPSGYGEELKASLAAYLGVRVEQIATGCGSDDVLDAAIRAFARAGSSVAVIDPTFPMIPIFARINGLEPVLVPLTPDYDVDVDRVLSVDASIIYLCSPNNPTGRVLDPRAVATIVERARGIVIIDEAYAEFAQTSAIDLANHSPRVLVTRTLSKAFGLAGLRVGYAVGDPTLIAAVEKSRGPFKLSAVAERAAVAAVTEDLEWVRETVRAAHTNRERFSAALADLGLVALPSDANFVLVPVQAPARIAMGLREQGIALKAFDNLTQVSPALAATNGGALRITIAPWDVLEATLAALREALRECSA